MNIDIIILIMAIVVSVISAITKRRNTRSTQKPSHFPEPDQKEDPWKEIVTKQPNTQPIANTHITNNKSFNISEKDKVNRSRKNLQGIKNNIAEQRTSVSSVQPENTILQDFSIEKAIIYSEILNPKFKE